MFGPLHVLRRLIFFVLFTTNSVFGPFRYIIPADANAAVLHFNETVRGFPDWISALCCNLMGSM